MVDHKPIWAFWRRSHCGQDVSTRTNQFTNCEQRRTRLKQRALIRSLRFASVRMPLSEFTLKQFMCSDGRHERVAIIVKLPNEIIAHYSGQVYFSWADSILPSFPDPTKSLSFREFRPPSAARFEAFQDFRCLDFSSAFSQSLRRENPVRILPFSRAQA